MTSAGPRPIDALIAGAQKAGTTSLADYLAQHPDICSHERAELTYFVDDLDYGRGYEAIFERSFGHCPPGARLLAKSVAVMASPELIERVHAHNPSIRIVIVLRNPVDRALSAYRYARRKGYEPIDSFERAIEAAPSRHGNDEVRIRNTSYLHYGDYLPQVIALFDRFGRDQVQVHLFEDLERDPVAVCRATFEFIGVDPDFVPDVNVRKNTGAAPRSMRLARVLSARHPWKRRLRDALPPGMSDRVRQTLERWNRGTPPSQPLSPDTRARLAQQYAARMDDLGDLIGRDLSAWSQPKRDAGDR